MRRDGEAHDAWQGRGTKHAHLSFHPLDTRCVLSIITGCSNRYSKQNPPCFGGCSGWRGEVEHTNTQTHIHSVVSEVRGQVRKQGS